ncbi:MAG TPA: DUF5335 family protein [Gemmatimonadales bacterium]|nr:DUF5335 family protein [Gemmatimonadales bacterium]
MAVTTLIPRERLARYFDEFTKRFLRDGSPEAVDVEVIEPDLGTQVAAQGPRLLGITYDRGSNALEFTLDTGDHRLYRPREVWTIEEPDGFISAVELVDAEGRKEVVSIKRVGIRRREDT